ncbi:MAG TPA: PIN domain-containing protein [Patescibacteria group bacterium]|nr:PIN domain-containing protein [Patescibacteria group bacterium]
MGRLTNFITSSQTVALDTNIFILASSPDRSGDTARSLLSHLKDVSPHVFLSVLVLEEFFVKVYKLKQDKRSSTFINFLTLNGKATLVDINRDIALLAGKLRALHSSLRTPDALHIATALSSNVDYFLTTDRRLPKKIDRLSIISLV